MLGEIALDSNVIVDLLGGNSAYEARAGSYYSERKILRISVIASDSEAISVFQP